MVHVKLLNMADGVKLRHFLEYDPNTWRELDRHSDKRHSIDTYQKEFFPWTHPFVRIGAEVLLDAFEAEPKVSMTVSDFICQFSERYNQEKPKLNENSAYGVLGRLSMVTFVYEGVDEHALDIITYPDSSQTFLLTNGGYYFCKKLINNDIDGRGKFLGLPLTPRPKPSYTFAQPNL